MKTAHHILTQIIGVTAGMIMSSIYITHSNTWKGLLPINLLFVFIKLVLNDYEKYHKK